MKTSTIIRTIMLLLPVVALAQSDVPAHDDHAHDGPAACGMHVFNDGGEASALANTARANPALYQRLLERTKHSPARYLQSAGDEVEFTFVVRNRVTQQYDEVVATLVYQGRRARIWLDNADKARVSASTINALARGLDSVTPTNSRNRNQSIIVNDEEVFGKPGPNAFDPGNPDVEDFLMTDIKEDLVGAFVAGFFSPWDQTDNPGSNRMNVLYIDSHEGIGSGVNAVLNTMAHEYQHLIHHFHNNQSETVFNEGCSEVASLVNGYANRGNAAYLRAPNIAMFTWHTDNGALILADYERALTYVWYMYEQCGEGFLTALTKSTKDNMDRVADALTQIGDNRDWRDLFCSWVTANYLRSFAQPHAYKSRLSNTSASVFATYNKPFAATNSVVVQQHAAAYCVYNNPGAVKVKFSASQPARAMAMLFRGDTAVEVWQLENKTEYVIGSYANYTKIVFGIANLAFNGQTVNWEINEAVLGVEDEASGANGLAVTKVAPNPAYGPIVVDFVTPAPGRASVELFDAQGNRVGTLADARFTAGAHQLTFDIGNLAAGSYLLRLTQAGRAVTRRVVVVR